MPDGFKVEQIDGRCKITLTGAAADRFETLKLKLESMLGKSITDEEAIEQLLSGLEVN